MSATALDQMMPNISENILWQCLDSEAGWSIKGRQLNKYILLLFCDAVHKSL